MSVFLLGLAILLTLFIALSMAARADPATLSKVIRYGSATLAGIAAAAFLVTGRMGFAMPLFALVFWLLGRPLSFRNRVGGDFSSTKSSGQFSEIRTAFFLMRLDHDSGAIEGDILAGRFEGRTLNSLSSDDLHLLCEEVITDPDSVRLLDTYLDRVAGVDGQEEEAAANQGRRPRGPMNRARALGILGLRAGSTQKQIRRAHRELMIKLHPDHGGSTDLAAEVNAAKDYLLGK